MKIIINMKLIIKSSTSKLDITELVCALGRFWKRKSKSPSDCQYTDPVTVYLKEIVMFLIL